MVSSPNENRDCIGVTADVALIAGPSNATRVLLVVRGNEPFQGRLALPGGFVELDEDLREAAVRELLEETGVRVEPEQLIQLGAYGKPGRDPRMRVVSVVFYATVDGFGPLSAGDDARDALIVPVEDALSRGLAFDHDMILREVMAAVG